MFYFWRNSLNKPLSKAAQWNSYSDSVNILPSHVPLDKTAFVNIFSNDIMTASVPD